MKDLELVQEKEVTTSKETKEITLKDGRKAVVFREPLGKDMRAAMNMIDGDQSKYLFALASLIVHIDGVTIPMEYYDKLPLKDATAITILLGEYLV